MKRAHSENADKQQAPQQMKADSAAGKSMSPPPFAPEASPVQMSKLEGDQEKDKEKEEKLATTQLKSEEDEEKMPG